MLPISYRTRCRCVFALGRYFSTKPGVNGKQLKSSYDAIVIGGGKLPKLQLQKIKQNTDFTLDVNGMIYK